MLAFRKSICSASCAARSITQVPHHALANYAAGGQQPFFGVMIQLHTLQAEDDLRQDARTTSYASCLRPPLASP